MVEYSLPKSDEKPCVLQIKGKGDFGQDIIINIEVHACDDVAISQFSTIPGSSLPYIDAKEFVEKVKETFKNCGCKVD